MTSISDAPEAKPAGVAGGYRIQITAWRPLTVTLPSGLVIHDITVHEREGNRWVSPPAREWVGADGKKQFARVFDFVNREIFDRFRSAVLAAFEEYLANAKAEDLK